MKAVRPSRCSPSDAVRCRPVRDHDDLAEHHRIRWAVFVQEQGLFEDDIDDRDGLATTVHVLGLVDDAPAGTVRLYPLDPTGELWRGDRLAVLPPQRRSGIGGPLVRLAVATAAARGGHRMNATVQAVNTAFFLDLGW